MLCIIPEYSLGIKSFRTIAQDAFAQPRCLKNAIHGAAVGMWEYRMVAGRLIKITHWERVTP